MNKNAGLSSDACCHQRRYEKQDSESQREPRLPFRLCRGETRRVGYRAQSPIQPPDTASVRRAVRCCGGSRPRDGQHTFQDGFEMSFAGPTEEETESHESTDRLFVKVRETAE